jgi:hypothetical protein
MKFAELMAQLKKLKFDTVRSDSDDYFEVVFIQDSLSEISQKLEGFFGLPLFPSDTGLTEQVRQEAQKYGGIMAGQTLYFSQQDAAVILAMLWPWSDKRHTTLKIVCTSQE